MKKKFENVYQFKITLDDIKPKIWRRIQVPETYTFEELHRVIQKAMGWFDYHLHEYEIKEPESLTKVQIGIPDEMSEEVLEENKEKIKDYFTKENPNAEYTYDFGDSWEHTIKLEKVLPRDEKVKYSICIAGERACPPEDCGGVWGYIDLLEIIRNKDDERHDEMMEWLGEEFDPEYFKPEELIFTDSK